MEDLHILELYRARDEQAIARTEEKYGRLCHTVAMNILGSREDTEECVNDTWLQAWNAIPPESPTRLGAYLCRITRNLAINHYRADRREKRGMGAAGAGGACRMCGGQRDASCRRRDTAAGAGLLSAGTARDSTCRLCAEILVRSPHCRHCGGVGHDREPCENAPASDEKPLA